MIFYHIILGGTPSIQFALSDTFPITNNCRNIINHRSDMLELCFFDHPLSIINEYGSYQVEGNSLLLFMPDCHYTLEPILTSEKVMNIMSVAVKSNGMTFTRYDLPVEEIINLTSSADKKSILLPANIQCDYEESTLFTAQLQTIMQHYGTGTTSSYMRALSAWFEFVATLDDNFRHMISNVFSGNNPCSLYVFKAQKYICAHLGDDLKLEHIAAELGISISYLCTLFRRITGHTITHYIGNARCQQIRKEILHTKDNFDIICNRFGLHDQRYAQRLYKKHIGISMQKCRQYGNGITLYHTNPYKSENIENDIYIPNDD